MSFLGHLSLTHLEFYTRTKKFTEDQTKQSNTEMWMLKEILQAISSHPSLKIDPANCPSIDELTTTDTLFVQAAFQGDLSQIKELVNKVDVNCKNKISQETALHKASENGHLEVVKYLVSNGANVNVKDKHDLTPIHDGARWGFLEVVKFLSQNGADLDSKAVFDWTPMHCAARSGPGYLEVVKFLAERGAKTDAKSTCNKTPLEMAVQYGFQHIVDYLTEKEKKDNQKQNDMAKAGDSSLKKPNSEFCKCKADCVICFTPRDGLYALTPCGHASLCKSCCVKVTSQKSNCPSCRIPVKNYMKIFFQ